MIGALFAQPNYVAAKELIDATVARHEALASNLANVEVPNYKRIDLDPGFRSELSRAIQGGDMARLSSLRPRLAVDTTAVAVNRDGNTVQLEAEMFQLAQNTLTHGLAAQLVTRNLQKLRYAISGRQV